jgi:hypothetical protein
MKGREKDRSRPLKDNKGHLKFGPSFKGHIQKKDAATPLKIVATLHSQNGYSSSIYSFFSILFSFISDLDPMYHDVDRVNEAASTTPDELVPGQQISHHDQGCQI